MIRDASEYCVRCRGKGAIKVDPYTGVEKGATAYEEGAHICPDCTGLGWVKKKRQAEDSSRDDSLHQPDWMDL